MLTPRDLAQRAYAIALYAALIVLSILAPAKGIAIFGTSISVRAFLFAAPFLILVILYDRYGFALLNQMIRLGFLLILFTLGVSLAAETAAFTNVVALAIIGVALGQGMSHLATLGICLIRWRDRSLGMRAFRFVVVPLAALFITWAVLLTFLLPALPSTSHLLHNVAVDLAVLSIWNILLSLIALGLVRRFE